MSSTNAYLKAYRYYLPPKVFSNTDYFEQFPEMASNKNMEKIGIKSRRHIEPGMTCSDMAVKAAEKLFAETEIGL